jgi:biotin transport system substrate-specific component
MSTSTFSNRRIRVIADFIPETLVSAVALIVGGAAFVGLLAQVSIPLGFTPVPVTGQTLGVLIVGSALGFSRAAASMSLYLFAGLAGVPWFAGGLSGYAPSCGYIVGFIVASAYLGRAAERGASGSVVRSVPSMFVAEAIIYAIGVTWLKVDLGVTWSSALSLGFTPFLWGDVLKAVIAGCLLPTAWTVVRKLK